ncbi:MAG: sulfite exporter TauE/SafE family protein [Gammaproteobacteria bacterium]|nr:sulfite exporter TauE/SafE family protein [Gammaproteobacteria bacterium]MCB1873015.1 sulfite exporter TauE/SafE family protein [Gammaproteobacteria bacterium]MCB1878826.1 sulfite exporter TauE/SafE family protein [Gammaproteobacteria bacterium]
MTGLLLMGLLIGMRHALEADHLAALASLNASEQSLGSAIRRGAVWGLGHTLALLLIGTTVMLLGSAVPQQLAAGLEGAVGIMLVLLGADVLRRLIVQKIHFHSHSHNQRLRHFHAHSHSGESVRRHGDSRHNHQHTSRFPVRALLVGLMHGMAGSAALTVLTLQTVASPLAGVAYMLLFGLGSIVGMALISMIIALPLRRLESRLTWLYTGFQLIVGSATIGLGVMTIIQSHTALIA